MTSFSYLGKQLARLRVVNGLSERALAEKLGTRETTIRNIEADKFFKAELFERILSFFGCHLAIFSPNELEKYMTQTASSAKAFASILPGLERWYVPALATNYLGEQAADKLKLSTNNRLKCVEICAGAGGQALGLEMAGFEHVALVEYEPEYCDALRQNRPDWNVICGDVKDFCGLPFAGQIDLLAGGVPCPPFSKAGKQLGSEDERDLFPEAIRLIGEIRPRAVMLENVRGFLDPIFDEYRRAILQKIEALGYTVNIKLLHASDYRVPQLRPRVVIVGIRKDIGADFEYPAPVTKMNPMTVASSIADLMKANGWKGADTWAIGANKIAPTVVGGSKKHGGPDLGPARARKAWAELGVDGMGVASEAPAPDFVGLPRLTPRMIARIQGFPDSWQFARSKTKACRMIGNAFPPPVAEAVGKQIAKTLEKK